MSIFSPPKIKKPPPPPAPPTRADASVLDAGQRASSGYSSMISSGSAQGLSRKASTQRGTLIGGA